jgi:hypothetical protein
MRFLSRNINEASTGSADAAKTFRTLGISIKDTQGRLLPTDEVLSKIAEKFKNMPDGAKKTATAMDIFGRSGADLVPLLNEGADGLEALKRRSDELGFTMSTELAKAGDEFNDSLDEMFAGLTGLRNLVGSQLIPVLLPLVKIMTNWFIANRKVVASKIEFFLRSLIQFATGAYKILYSLFRVFDSLITIMGGFENAVTLITNALLFFVGAKMIYMVGQLAIALYGIAGAFTAANAAAVAIPLAIGAAVAILLLLIEDLYVYLTDDSADTMFGSLFKSASEFFDAIPDWGKAIITYLLTPFRAVAGALRILKTIWNGDFTSMKGLTDISNDIAGSLEQVATGGSSLGQSFGFTPAYSPAVTSRQERNFMAPQTNIVNNINVGQNDDPLGIAKSVKIGTQDGMDSSLRKAQRSFTDKGAAY